MITTTPALILTVLFIFLNGYMAIAKPDDYFRGNPVVPIVLQLVAIVSIWLLALV